MDILIVSLIVVGSLYLAGVVFATGYSGGILNSVVFHVSCNGDRREFSHYGPFHKKFMGNLGKSVLVGLSWPVALIADQKLRKSYL